MPGLGRAHKQDDRDNRHQMRTVLPTAELDVDYRYWWAQGAWLDQGETPTCVGHAWCHWLEDGPVTHVGTAADPFAVYRRAQVLDEWAGEDYDGTSVRAGAKVLVELGLISRYLWAWDLDTLVRAVLTTGPVVVGTNWYRTMFDPDPTGRVELGGPIDGGHAWELNGANVNRETFRAKNSWGRGWSRNGHFTIGFDDMARLLAEDGEACLAVENPTE